MMTHEDDPSVKASRRGVATRLDTPRVAVPLLLVLAMALRLHNLSESLWFDEVVYSTHYRTPSVDRLWALVMKIPGPPLYPVLMYSWVSLVGDHELIVRLPPLLFGLGSIVLTYFIARRFHRPFMPLLAGLLLCFSPVHVWYSQEATPYAMTMCLLLTAVFVWPRLRTPPFSLAAYAVYSGALLMAVLTHYYAAFFLLPFTLLAWRTDKPIRQKVFLTHAVVVLSVVAWLAVRYASGRLITSPPSLRPFTLLEWWMLFFHWFLQGNSIWTTLPIYQSLTYLVSTPLLLVMQIGAAILVLRGLWPDREKESQLRTMELTLYLVTLPGVLYVLTILGLSHLSRERYVVFTIPFFALALARGATGFSRATVRKAVAGAVAMASVASYAAFLVKDGAWTVYRPNPDWRRAAAFVRSLSDRPERVIIMGGVPLDDFDYYLRKEWPDGRPRLLGYASDRFERLQAEGQLTQLVVVRNRYWRGDGDNVLDKIMHDQRFRFTTLNSFNGVDLYMFVPRNTETPMAQ